MDLYTGVRNMSDGLIAEIIGLFVLFMTCIVLVAFGIQILKTETIISSAVGYELILEGVVLLLFFIFFIIMLFRLLLER